MIDAQERAVRYLRRRGQESAAADVVDRLRAAYQELDDFNAGLTEAQARQAPGPGEWSVSDLADHLLESERAGLDELRCLVAGERPPGPPVPASLRSKAPHLRPWAWLRLELAQVHADILEVAAAGGDADPAEASAEIVLVVLDDAGAEVEWNIEADWRTYCACLRVHALEHLAQAKRAVGA